MNPDWLTENEPLFKHTYYRIGGPARWFALPKTTDDLQNLVEFLRSKNPPFFILGAGSNILVSDEGFDGLIVRASRFNLETVRLDERTLRVGASVAVSTLLRRCSQEGWGGLEFLTGIPGSIGGVTTMNAGTHLGEAKSAIKKVDVLFLAGADAGKTRSYSGPELKYEYRRNLFLPQGAVVVSTEWEILPEDPKAVKARIDETLARRKATQPIDYPSCGSVFKNPKASGLSAWQVIDRLGLRGHRIGDAQFAEKHSNFILNLDHATAKDVRALILLAKARARTEMGIALEEEVLYLGRFSDQS